METELGQHVRVAEGAHGGGEVEAVRAEEGTQEREGRGGGHGAAMGKRKRKRNEEEEEARGWLVTCL